MERLGKKQTINVKKNTGCAPMDLKECLRYFFSVVRFSAIFFFEMFVFIHCLPVSLLPFKRFLACSFSETETGSVNIEHCNQPASSTKLKLLMKIDK